MKFSEDNFKELEEQLKVKQPHLNRLKSSIVRQAAKPQKSRKRQWLVAFSLLCLVVLSFPIYSPVVANIVAKVKPLAIEEQGDSSHALVEQLMNLLSANGYDAVNSVGVRTKDNVVEITFEKGEDYDVDAIKALVQHYLLEEGYDTYTVEVLEIKVERPRSSTVFDEVTKIVEAVMTDFGYAGTEEMAYTSPGLQQTWFSNIVTINMPDHIEEADDIVAAIEAAIEESDLDVKKVEVEPFNMAHRILDGAWGTAANTIYTAMAGQSAYELEGLSYSVKKGHATITMQTTWTEAPAAELVTEIESEIRSYLQSPEVLAYLPEQAYTIQFVNGEKVLLEISNR